MSEKHPGFAQQQNTALGAQAAPLNFRSPLDSSNLEPRRTYSSSGDKALNSQCYPLEAAQPNTRFSSPLGNSSEGEPRSLEAKVEGVGTGSAVFARMKDVGKRVANRLGLGGRNPSSNDTASAQPLVGIIDTGFGANSHGAEMQKTISNLNPQAAIWQGDGVGKGRWANSLNEFVEVAEASGRRAIANLSFDLTQVNPDGSTSTRYQLTADEQGALATAEKAGIPVFVSIGNEASHKTAWEQADRQFDNLVVIGGAEGRDRAATSSYGNRLDLLAPNRLSGHSVEGTSLATAYATGVASKVWAANSALSDRQLEQVLKSSASDLKTPGRDAETGFGLLNPAAAIQRARRIDAQLTGTAYNKRGNATWKGENGVVASERPNRLLEGTGTGTVLTQNEPEPSRYQGMSPDAAERQAQTELAELAVSYPGYNLAYNPSAPEYNEDPGVVRHWQQRMQDLGYNLEADGYYGSQSAQVARQFQEANGLEVDGFVGPETWAASFRLGTPTAQSETSSAPTMSADAAEWQAQTELAELAASYPGYNLAYNPSAPEYNEDPGVVQRWQQRMQDLGYNLEADGYYGSQSAQVARQFQEANGLKVDGFVGPETWAATFDTNNVTNSPMPAPLNTPGIPGTSVGAATQKMLDVARAYIGVQEQGDNGGAEVEEFQRAVDGVAQGEPWCMSFVQHCLKAAESGTNIDSTVFQSEHCLTVWNNSPAELKRSHPEPGSLVIWQHGNSTSGHVGIVETVNPDGTFTTIEGNTSDSSSVEREGDGVYRKQRDMNGAGDMRVVGFLKVFPKDSTIASERPNRLLEGTGTEIVSTQTEPEPSRYQGMSPDAAERQAQTELAELAASYPGYNLAYNPSAPEYNEDPGVVQRWQQRMQDLGYNLEADGYYGSQSAQVARQFQEANGLEVDGFVGPETWSASFGTASKPTQKETSPYQGMSADAAERWSESAHNHETHNQVLNQIRETEQSVPGDYDSYIVAQTLRRKTNDKYRGGSFEIFTGWKNGWPLNRYPDDNANSTYAKAENLEEFKGSLPLKNGMKLPTAHFLGALSSQFGTVGGESWNLTYAGDLGSVVGAMQYPDDWITSNTPESEKAKEQLASLNSAESKLPIAIDAKAPPEQLDADIVAHVVGNRVNSEGITISEAITDVSQMSKREVYDEFLQSEFGYQLSELNDSITGSTKRWELQTKLQDRISTFIGDYITLQNSLASKNEARSWIPDWVPFIPDSTEHKYRENLYNPLASINLDPENLAMVADYFVEHIESNA